jgi:peptide-methionine (S)-S-oxide reductase
MRATIEFTQLGAAGITKDNVEVGQQLFLQNGAKAEIIEVTESGITIDANPPLSRIDVEVTVKLNSVVAPSLSNDSTHSTWGKKWSDPKYEVATVAGGCFWGLELAYQRMNGVVGTKVGYTKGNVDNPSYQDVCSGSTGHTEAVQIAYDSTVCDFSDICDLLLERLGPSVKLLNQVGNDRGTQYRHGIYPHDPDQLAVALTKVAEIPDCVTEVVDAGVFWDGEEYHQQYLMKGGQDGKKEAKETIRCYG